MNTVMLKNGKEEAEGLVGAALTSLRSLMNKQPVAFYELVMKARNPEHKMFGKTEQTCIDALLLEAGGTMHDSIRNIILSAVEGEELNMRIVSPVA